MERSRTRTFYRALKKNPPTDRDFMTPREQRGEPPETLTPEQRRSWESLTFYDTKEGVRRQAASVPGIGKHVARFELPEDAGIAWEETLHPGHFDVRGDREVIKRALTEDIEPI